MTTFETIDLTDDIRGGTEQQGVWARVKDWYWRSHAFGTCQNQRYANSRTGHRELNPSWPCSDYLNGTRPLPK